MGVENNIIWSEIGSGFGEPGGTPLPRFPRSTPRGKGGGGGGCGGGPHPASACKLDIHTPLWLLIERIIFLTREKTSFAILIGLITF